ncbi:MAG: toxin VasX [Pseudomonadota bacterium]
MRKPFYPMNPNNVSLSREDARTSLGVCPLMKSSVQLVPLRYGLVDNPGLDPSDEIAMPYRLSARPLGFRLLRDGWLYVIDDSTASLSEYRVREGLVSEMLWQGTTVGADERLEPIKAPTLIYLKTSTLYVSYSEVQWTAKKCRQVLESPGEREHFMQAVDLSKAHCEAGAPHLLTHDMAEHWLAEVATERLEAEQQSLDSDASLADHAAYSAVQLSAELPAHERQPYLWEQPVQFAESSINRLTGCVDPLYRHDVMYLVLDDTLGVLRDLANFQDQVVGWIGDWAAGGQQEGNNERDYLLGCYIESLSQLNAPDISALANATDDPAIKAMFTDLQGLPDPDRGITEAALLEYLNNGGLVTAAQTPVSPELLVLRKAAEDEAIEFVHSRGLGKAPGTREDTDRRYYTREHFRVAPATFVDPHLEALVALGKQRGEHIDDILHGAKLGQRGVNDLIDREAMDRDLATHRAGLVRWNQLLDCITADRVALVTSGAFHKAAWYFDPLHSPHIHHAFTLEYACLKDICRSDEASEQLFAFTEREPQFSRPLYYTLPFSEQTGLWVQYAFLTAAGVTLLNNAPDYLAGLRRLEQGRLPALDDMDDGVRRVANAASNTLTPALNRGLEKLLGDFDGLFKGQAIPDMDELLRRLPIALKSRILQAAKTEGVTFHFATAQEKASLRETLNDVLGKRQSMAWLKKERALSNRQNGHKSSKSQGLLADIKYLRWQLDLEEGRLAASISPITELPDEHARLYGSTPGRAGLTVIFPPEGRRQVAGLMDNFRKGVGNAPVMNVLGDGAALLLFVAQAVNLVQLYKEMRAAEPNDRQLMPMVSALLATGAAGFAAAQGVFDTALGAQAAKLGEDLMPSALSKLQVTMGKLHVGLGGFTYLFGFIAAAISFNGSHSNWVQAVRSGNRGAQHGAMLSMVGAGGLALSNAYGLGNTLRAGYLVVMAAKGAARDAAWAAAGVRLGSVFFRSSLVGGLFTLLELAGVWLYNRYNLSAHDKWLECTPWGKDVTKRKTGTLENFQRYLSELLQAPFVEIKGAESPSFWQSLLPNTRMGEICVVFPGLKNSDFQATLEGIVSHGLRIGAQRITTVMHSHRDFPQEQLEEVTEQVHARLSRVMSLQEHGGKGDPLALKLTYPRNPEPVPGKVSEALLIELVFDTRDDKGGLLQQTFRIRFNPLETGRFLAAAPRQSDPKIALLNVDVMALEVASI